MGEEKQHNLRLTKPKEEFVTIMASLGLPYPKKIGVFLTTRQHVRPQAVKELYSSAIDAKYVHHRMLPASPADEAVPANMVCGIHAG